MITLGDIGVRLLPLKVAGVTRAAVLYMVDLIWWEDV